MLIYNINHLLVYYSMVIKSIIKNNTKHQKKSFSGAFVSKTKSKIFQMITQ